MATTRKRKIQPGFVVFARKHGTTMGTIVGLHVKNATSNFTWNVRTYNTKIRTTGISNLITRNIIVKSVV